MDPTTNTTRKNTLIDSSPTPIDPLEMFLNSIVSDETRRQYRNKLKVFLNFIGIENNLSLGERAKQFAEFARKDNGGAFTLIIKFILHQKSRYEKREITAGSLRNYYKPLRVFCEVNDVHFSWKKITMGLPKSRKFAQDRAPTKEEIKKVMEYPDRRIKPIVLVMSASGIRVGAWNWLKWRHVKPIFEDGKVIAAKMNVYAGEAEEYATFITPEAYQTLKEWMDLRAEYGEKITPESWLMRDLFRTATLTYGAHYGNAWLPHKLQASGIRTMLKRAWISQGLMKDKDSKLYDFKSSHGFRKRFKTQCELAGVKPLTIEFMLGHDTGIAGSSYYRPNDQELLQEYLKAVDSLSINNDRELVEKQLVALNEKTRENELRLNSELDIKRSEIIVIRDKYEHEIGALKAQVRGILTALAGMDQNGKDELAKKLFQMGIYVQK